MLTYSIEDLLVGQTYYPRSIARRHQFGTIDFAEKRDDVYLGTNYEAYRIRFDSDKWATVAVKVSDL